MNQAAATAAPSASLPRPEAIHRRLAQFNQRRLRPGQISGAWLAELREEAEIRLVEGSFVEEERRVLAPVVAGLPTDADGFMQWFESLEARGPGQHDALFPWLASSASLDQMRWFLTQEVATEAGFDDLVALAQLGLPPGPKLEMARNYWDEMGRGHEDGMHGLMLQRVVRVLRLEPGLDKTVWESLALANLMLALAANRRYTYQAIGALGAIEMTAPGRVGLVNDGLRRLGIAAPARSYYQLHAGLDVQHSQAWNREVIRPLVESGGAEVALAIAEGALLRLQAGARCYQRYRQQLGVPAGTERAAA